MPKAIIRCERRAPEGMPFQSRMELHVFYPVWYSIEEIKKNRDEWSRLKRWPQGLKRHCATHTELDYPPGETVHDEYWTGGYSKIVITSPREGTELRVYRYEFPALDKIKWGVEPHPLGKWYISQRLTIPAKEFQYWMLGLEKLERIARAGTWRKYKGSYFYTIRFPWGRQFSEVRFEVSEIVGSPGIYLFRAHLWVPRKEALGLRRTMAGISFRSDDCHVILPPLYRAFDYVRQHEFDGQGPSIDAEIKEAG